MARVLGKAMPWLSLFWGVASGVVIARRFDMASHVLAFAVALFIASFVLGLWSTWLERARRREEEIANAADGADSLESGARKDSTRLRALALRHQAPIDWAMATGTQIFAQYLLMFALPFLWYARAWGMLVFSTLLVATTLWDPLFLKLVRSYAYRLILRATSFALATSFLVGALVPRHAHFYALAALAAALAGGLPWRLPSRSGPAGIGAFTLPFVPFVLLVALALLHIFVGGPLRFPLLAVWVKGGSFALQDSTGGWASGGAPSGGALNGGDPMSRDHVEGLLSQGGRLCCVSPLVAPRALHREVVHEWWLDGKKLDAIELPPLQGRDEGAAYRTFSCKKNLPAAWADGGVVCRVFVGRGEAGVEVGRVLLGTH
jgi:hypothetical protein